MQIRRRVIDAWLHDLRAGWGDRAERAASALTSANGQVGDLYEIGVQLATEGHPLDEVMAWFSHLATKSRGFRQALESGGVIQLASGWADGRLHDDAAKSVTPFEVLRLRLHQQVQRGDVLGQPPGTHLALVVIESDVPAAAAHRLVHHARAAFCAGETIAPTPSGKLFILVHRDQSVHELTTQVTAALRADNELVGTSVRVWIEPLAMSADHLDSHLLGLAS